MGNYNGTTGDDVWHQKSHSVGVALGLGGNDQLTGANIGDQLYGGSGSDTLIGGNGRDLLDAEGDSSPFSGGSGLPTDATPDAVDKALGGAGDDDIRVGYGDTADGGSGNNGLALKFLGLSTGLRLI